MEELLAVHTPRYAVVDLKLKAKPTAWPACDAARAQPANAHRGADRLCQHCHGGGSHQARRLPLPGQAVQHRRHRSRFALQEGNTEVELTNRSSSIKTLEWERIHEVLAESDFNISEAARRLGMHRRTLSRKLGKQRV
jgi:two-component system response regulator RegA